MVWLQRKNGLRSTSQPVKMGLVYPVRRAVLTRVNAESSLRSVSVSLEAAQTNDDVVVREDPIHQARQ